MPRVTTLVPADRPVTVRAIQDGNLQEPFEGYIYNCSQDFVFGVQEIDYRVYGEAFRQDAHEHLSAIE